VARDAVEAMGRARSALADISQEDILRANLYRMLAHVLRAPPQQSDLELLAGLSRDRTRLGAAIGGLAHLARRTSAEAARREYHSLFIGLERGEVLPYGSHYRGGMHEEHTVARLRSDMARRGIEIAPERSEPEDHIATLCEIMANLILGDRVGPASLEEQKSFFMSHIAVWAKHFFTDLEAARSSVFYAAVGKVGAVFMDIEEAAFEMI
jgi:TorA maturation chaperone TorD